MAHTPPSIAPGGVAFSPDRANLMAEVGYRIIFLGFDRSLLAKGLASAFQGIQQHRGIGGIDAYPLMLTTWIFLEREPCHRFVW
jgi:hypothetical protein